MTSLLVWCMSSVPRLFNCTSEHDKSLYNKKDIHTYICSSKMKSIAIVC